MRRYSQFRSMPATWKMHDKAPVQHLRVTDVNNPVLIGHMIMHMQ